MHAKARYYTAVPVFSTGHPKATHLTVHLFFLPPPLLFVANSASSLEKSPFTPL